MPRVRTHLYQVGDRVMANPGSHNFPAHNRPTTGTVVEPPYGDDHQPHRPRVRFDNWRHGHGEDRAHWFCGLTDITPLHGHQLELRF